MVVDYFLYLPVKFIIECLSGTKLCVQGFLLGCKSLFGIIGEEFFTRDQSSQKCIIIVRNLSVSKLSSKTSQFQCAVGILIFFNGKTDPEKWFSLSSSQS